jgi:glycosyltransferase involved in cell wall biosynthesis
VLDDCYDALPGYVCAVVTYRRPEQLEIVLKAVLNQQPAPMEILVLDNSPLGDPHPHALPTGIGPRVTRVVLPHNPGPAGALHFAVEHFNKRPEYADKWMLVLDDDDPPETDISIRDLLHAASMFPPNVAAVGMAGGQLGRLSGIMTSTLQSPSPAVECDYLSGSFLPLYRCSALEPNPFWAELFWGFEELGAGLHLKSRGYSLIACNDLAHKHGYARKATALRRTTPGREYYSTRNLLRVLARFKPTLLPATLIRQAAGCMRGRPAITRRETSKARLLAFVDAIRGITGRRGGLLPSK